MKQTRMNLCPGPDASGRPAEALTIGLAPLMGKPLALVPIDSVANIIEDVGLDESAWLDWFGSRSLSVPGHCNVDVGAGLVLSARWWPDQRDPAMWRIDLTVKPVPGKGAK